MIKVGHRGAAGYEPENTIKSFQKAIELGADMIEFDVHVCKSGELVVIHDDTVERTTTGKGAIADKDLSELKELGIPTVAEVLELAFGKVKINIELKGKNTAEPVSKIIEEYVAEKGWSYDDFLVSSFDHKELCKFKELTPQVNIGFLANEISDDFIDFAVKNDAYAVNVSKEAISKDFVNEAHSKGLKVYVFTPNELADIEKSKTAGADYICSNFPDRLN